MKNTTFRRRALLSSVAMLLVALVALGSATFAWFTSDPNAKTKGLELKATSSLGLVVQSQTEKGIDSTWWSHEAMFNAGSKNGNTWTAAAAASIGAASQDCTANGTGLGIYTIAAANDNAYNADDTKQVGTSSTPNHFEEKLYMKVTGSNEATVKLTKVTIGNTSLGSTTLANALRVAVLRSDGSLLGIWKAAGTDNEYLTATGSYSSSLSSSAYTSTASGATVDLNVKASSGKVSDAGTDYITIRVFLDGEDQYVYSQNITATDMASVMSGLVLELEAV